MKHTAVDWLRFELLKNLIELQDDYKNTDEIWKKAKEMEEGQIALAYSTGTLEGVNKNFTNGYTYYEKTYKWYK